MDKSKRKELLEQYKEVKTFFGVVCIKNTVNGKIFLNGYPNLKNKWSTIQSQLDMGQFPNAPLLADWKAHGKDAFTFEVLEEKSTEDVSDVAFEVKMMLKSWLQKLEPFDDKGYNTRKSDAAL